jgi:hypothetical protein
MDERRGAGRGHRGRGHGAIYSTPHECLDPSVPVLEAPRAAAARRFCGRRARLRVAIMTRSAIHCFCKAWNRSVASSRLIYRGFDRLDVTKLAFLSSTLLQFSSPAVLFYSFYSFCCRAGSFGPSIRQHGYDELQPFFPLQICNAQLV